MKAVFIFPCPSAAPDLLSPYLKALELCGFPPNGNIPSKGREGARDTEGKQRLEAGKVKTCKVVASPSQLYSRVNNYWERRPGLPSHGGDSGTSRASCLMVGQSFRLAACHGLFSDTAVSGSFPLL